MSKKLRREPIYIAPQIAGWLDENDMPHVIDEQNNRQLNPHNIWDKIYIYERQVKGWFLNPATNLVRYNNKNKGFIVLMICLSYLEGIEQYRQGEESNRRSKEFFVYAMKRIYPTEFQVNQLEDFYKQARCGLFHNGMVRGKIIINNSFSKSIQFNGDYEIKVSPSKFLRDIKKDFEKYIQELNINSQLRNDFDSMYSNI